MGVNLGKREMVVKKYKKHHLTNLVNLSGNLEIKRSMSVIATNILGLLQNLIVSFLNMMKKLNKRLRKHIFPLLQKLREWRGSQDLFIFLTIYDQSYVNYASEVWGFEGWQELATFHLKAC